tara:strand:+ start:255 stop:1043 length:789 start_codon:yes stop_codon:yes gene_type:complete
MCGAMLRKKYICGIVGHPLKKPRSIPIWKKFFKKKKILSSMEKFDIDSNNFHKFISRIKKEKKFLAMAVTMPYKKKIIQYLRSMDSFAKKTRSVNLVVKKAGHLHGYNTDIFGALQSIKKEVNYHDKILIIGLGGTGQAIFNYLRKTFPKKYFILISSKSKRFFKAKNLILKKKLNKDIIKNRLLIINCTPIGSSLKKIFIKSTPIKKEFFKFINNKSFIFDIIYSPKKTVLNKLCKKHNIKYTNGTFMNTVQAERALKIVF